MTAQERSTQLRVGIFMAIGLLAIALMVVYFGRFGESIHGYLPDPRRISERERHL